MKTNKHTFEKIYHLIVGFIFILKGVDKIQHHPLIGLILLIFGIAVIAYFIYISTKQAAGEWLSIIVHLFEAIALMFTAYLYYQEGKTFLPYVFAASAVGFLIATFVSIQKTIKH